MGELNTRLTDENKITRAKLVAQAREEGGFVVDIKHKADKWPNLGLRLSTGDMATLKLRSNRMMLLKSLIAEPHRVIKREESSMI